MLVELHTVHVLQSCPLFLRPCSVMNYATTNKNRFGKMKRTFDMSALALPVATQNARYVFIASTLRIYFSSGMGY